MFNRPENAILTINEKVEELEQFFNTENYSNMLNESNNWFNNNVLPENQFKIIYSFLQEFTIFD